MTAIRTSLTRHAPSMRDPDPSGQRRAAEQAWKSHGIVVLLPGDPQIDRLDRELVEAIAKRLYGGRNR